jgi:hypothetical protein
MMRLHLGAQTPVNQNEEQMATFRLTTMKSWKTEHGFTMIMDFSEPFPTRTVEAKTTAEALAHLDAYAKEAEATGLSLMCSINLKRRERAPSGFRKLADKETVRFVNHVAEPVAA